MSFWPRALIPSPNRIPKELPEAETQAVRRGSPGSGWTRWESLGPGEWEHPSWAVCVSRTLLILIFLARPTRSVCHTLGALITEA